MNFAGALEGGQRVEITPGSAQGTTHDSGVIPGYAQGTNHVALGTTPGGLHAKHEALVLKMLLN